MTSRIRNQIFNLVESTGGAVGVKPEFSSAVIENANPDKVVISFTQALDEDHTPATTAFTLAGKTISTVEVSGFDVTLTVSVAYAFGDTVVVSYTSPGSNRLTSLTGGEVDSFTNKSVTNNVLLPPTVLSAVIPNAARSTVVITFATALNEASVPATSAFTIAGKTISNVAVAGAVVTLTVTVAYDWGQTAAVSYTKPGSNFLVAVNTLEVASFTGQAITNNIVIQDASGNLYTEVVIGTQTWLVEALRTTKFRDGTDITRKDANWATDTTGQYDWSNGDINKKAFGAMYNGPAINNAKGIAPVGYHVPSSTEWTTLLTYLGGAASCGDELKAAGTSVGWTSNNTGTNTTGFTMCGTTTLDETGNHYSEGVLTQAACQNNLNAGWKYYVRFQNTSDVVYDSYANSDYQRNATGFVVRCIKG